MRVGMCDAGQPDANRGEEGANRQRLDIALRPTMRIPSLFVVVAFALTSGPAAARMMEPTFHRAPSAVVVHDADLDVAVTKRKPRPPPRKKPRRSRPAPDPRRAPVKKVNPALVGLAAAGGGAGGALIGATGVGISTLVLFGVFGAPALPVVITAIVIGVGLGVAAPFIAAVGGGAGVLLTDPRSKPEEWSSLMQCAASGYCAGVNLVAGTLLGSACGQAPGSSGPSIPGPDKAAEWTAGAAIAGLVGGTVMGGLIGWSVAPVPEDPVVPITVGALGGAVLGAGISAGVAAAVASAIKR